MADASLLSPEEQTYVNQAVVDNITSSIVGPTNPGTPTYNPLIFSHSDNSTLDAMIGQYRQGIIKIPASSVNFLANANFTILNRSILSAPYISGSYNIPQGAVKPSLTYYYGINLWQLNLSGIGNLSGNGVSMLDMLLRSNPTDRRNFLSTVEPYAVGVTGGTNVTFCAPLYLPWNGPGWAGGGYNLDANVSASTLQVSIQLNPVYNWIGGVTGGIVGNMPTSFLNYDMKMMNQLDVLNQEFAPSKISSRGLFRLPFPYYQQYPLFSQSNNNPSGIQSLSLQSIPNGELVSIMIHGIPSANKGTSSVNTAVDITPVTFTYVRLELQGTRLIELETAQEIAIQNNYFSVGSSSGFNFNLTNAAFTTTTGGVNSIGASTAPVVSSGQFTALECFTSSPSNFFDGNGVVQLAQNFSGQIFTFFYRLAPQYTSAQYPLIDWYITYVANGQINWSDGVAKLIV